MEDGLESSRITLDGSLEKGFACLARRNAIVETRRHITADETEPFWSVLVFKIVLAMKSRHY